MLPALLFRHPIQVEPWLECDLADNLEASRSVHASGVVCHPSTVMFSD